MTVPPAPDPDPAHPDDDTGEQTDSAATHLAGGPDVREDAFSTVDPDGASGTDWAASGDTAAVLAAAYAELHSLLLDSPDVQEFLTQVAVLAASVIPGASCGITMRRDHEVATVAASDEFAAQLDEIQYGRGQGPCLQALNTGEVVLVPDLAADDRWGDYRMHAITYGVRSSLSLPLVLAGDIRGALNLYTTTPNSFGADETRRSHAFAQQAANALGVVLRQADQIVIEEHLREALATRAIVDQAVGILMGQRRVNAHEAYAVLRHTSQTRNLKLRDIAADLIQTVTGEPPRPPRPFADPR